MESVILQLGTNITALVVVVAVVWWRIGELKNSINKLWERFDEHCASEGAHATNPIRRQIDKLEARLNKHLNGRKA